MKLKKAAFLLLLVLLFSTHDLYARGVDGTNEAWGDLGAIIIILMAAYIRKQKVIKKNEDSEQIIAQAADPMWDEGKMIALTKDVFFKMQQAWMDRNLDSVKKLISTELYDKYTLQLDFMKTNHEKKIMEKIVVRDVRIVSIEDYKDNVKDVFVGYVEGAMKDYTIDEQTGTMIANKKKQKLAFSDTYHFIRKADKWILNNIKNNVTTGDIEQWINYKEE